jgi:hypothetical protein
MGKATGNRIKGIESQDELEHMYCKVTGQSPIKKRDTIKCPECGKEIPIALPFKLMNQTIENHVQFHKNQQQSLVSIYSKSMNVRLSLAHQILHDKGPSTIMR